MTQTLLQTINQAQAELGLPQSSSIFNNTTDASAVQMLALMQGALHDLRKEYIWTGLETEYDLTVTAPITTYTGTVTQNSATITAMSSVVGLTAPYWIVSGSGLLTNARVTAVGSNTITMSMPANGNATATALTFAQDTYPLPSDFDYMQSRTWWDRTNRWELLGPDSAQLDQWHRSGIVTTGPRRHFRIIGSNPFQLRFWPPPAEISNPLQMAFEYISTNCINVGGSQPATSSVWTTDSDTSIWSSRLLVLYLKKAYWQVKGFNYIGIEDQYTRYLDTLIAQDGANQTLNLTKRSNPIFVSPSNVQDGFFPGPIGPNTG